ncbi:MAG: NAD-dependent epimerase/dehydratase family protein, partial [Muribaculaceae bacterium]|nr:NAD-dependent epimerase/dehydratase family protein [Muribaculaceae bacterium]
TIAPEATDMDILQALAAFGIEPGKVTLWGTGTPLREFLWSEDMADACVHILLNVSFADIVAERGQKEVRNTHINIGTGRELTIAQLARTVAEAVGFKGQILWDSSKPDGTMRKLCDVSRLHALGWHHSIELDKGVPLLYKWYLENTGL